MSKSGEKLSERSPLLYIGRFVSSNGKICVFEPKLSVSLYCQEKMQVILKRQNKVDCSWWASVASETLTGVTQSKIGDVYWRASVASETVLGVDNAKSGICYIYICMYGWYVCPLNARGQLFSPKKHVFLDLTPVYSETKALSKTYFILKRSSVRKFLRKQRLLFKKQKVAATCYYGIEIPLPDLKSKLRCFRGDTECRLLVVKSHW